MAYRSRYYQRDLPQASESPVKSAGQQDSSSAKPSVWVQGAKAAALITFLGVLGLILRPENSVEWIGDLTIGSVVGFFLWWLICTGLVALWRKSKTAVVVLIFGIVLLAVTIIITIMDSMPPIKLSPPTMIPTMIPTMRPTMMPTQFIKGCISRFGHEHIGKIICVFGRIFSIDTFEKPNGIIIQRITFEKTGIGNAFYLLGTNIYFTNVHQGDCVAATGLLKVSTFNRMGVPTPLPSEMTLQQYAQEYLGRNSEEIAYMDSDEVDLSFFSGCDQ